MENLDLKNTSVLVTGGTGFAGAHLVEQLVERGAQVFVTYRTANPRSYFYTQKLEKKVALLQLDIRNAPLVEEMVIKHRIQIIFHLAAQPLVEAAYVLPRHTLETNIIGTINILEAARLSKDIQGVIVASSDKSYGICQGEKYTETDPLQGIQPYEVSKSAADLICNSYAKTYDLPIVITRFGNIYGEGDLNFSRIIPGIMKALIRRETLYLRSNGTLVRDYLHVKDVAKGYILLAEQISRTKGEAYNFGSNDTLSVLDLIFRIQSVLNQKVEFQILNQATNEIPYQSLNFEKVSQLGWNNTYSIESSIAAIFNWYKNTI